MYGWMYGFSEQGVGDVALAVPVPGAPAPSTTPGTPVDTSTQSANASFLNWPCNAIPAPLWQALPSSWTASFAGLGTCVIVDFIGWGLVAFLAFKLLEKK